MTKMIVGTKNVFEPLYFNDNIAINSEFQDVTKSCFSNIFQLKASNDLCMFNYMIKSLEYC